MTSPNSNLHQCIHSANPEIETFSLLHRRVDVVNTKPSCFVFLICAYAALAQSSASGRRSWFLLCVHSLPAGTKDVGCARVSMNDRGSLTSYSGTESTMGNASILASPSSHRSRSTTTSSRASPPDEAPLDLLTQESDRSRKHSFSDEGMENGNDEMERRSKHQDATMTTFDRKTRAEEREQPSDKGRELLSSLQDTEMAESACHGENEQGEVEEKVESQLQVEDDTSFSSDKETREIVSNNFFMTQPDIDSRQDIDVEEDGRLDTCNIELGMDNNGEPLPFESDALDRPATPGSDDESSLDESDDYSVMPYGEEYMETVERNVRRNKERLSFLGFEAKAQTPVRRITSPEEKRSNVDLETGMLFIRENGLKVHDARNDDIDELYQRYPYRHFQIKTLVSMIGAAMGQTVHQGEDPYVPPPIFVSGPSGTGKTSIVRDVLDILKRHYASDCSEDSTKRVIGSAYVNCATVEPCSLEGVLESAYSQLASSLELPQRVRKAKRKKDSSTVGRKERKMIPGFRIESALEEARSNDVEYSTDNEAEIEDAIEASRTKLSQMKQHDQSESDFFANPVSRLEPRRTRNGASVSAGQTDSTKNPVNRRETRSIRNATNISPSQTAPDASVPCIRDNKTIRKVEPMTTSHGAPMAFGRVLVPLFGSSSLRSTLNVHPGSAFFVLDHADRLFSLSPKQVIESNNFLAQLLLLPQVMGLNLTFIIVSRSTLLDSSRINNCATRQKALGTVVNGTRPIRVQFPAYQGNAAFTAILKQPKIVELIVGRQRFESSHVDQRQKFEKCIIDSFLDTVVQTLSSVTRDVREMIRMGRDLWPSYILPLDPQRIQTTLDTARRRRNARLGQKSKDCSKDDRASEDSVSAEELQKELLAILDEALLPIMKTCLEEDLFVIKRHGTCLNMQVDNAGSVIASHKATCDSDLPYLSKCLLLAAFVCQNNKSDKDKTVFTIQRNGKKNSRQGHRAGDNDADALAYGSTSLEHQPLKMLRPRTFPLERMLSVFVNIVGLIGGEEKLRLSVNVSEPSDLLNSMGSSSFFESLVRLREIGLLHEVPGTSIGGDTYTFSEGINLTSTKYWCELNRDDAEALARSVDFPLENFLL